MNLTVGSIVLDSETNEYRLIEQLGKGGFGAVYKAIRIKDNSTVAVKVFSSDFPSPESMLSFQKELQQSLLVKSDNVIEYFYAHDGSVFNELPPYIIMEFADGGSLADLLRERKNTNTPFSTVEMQSMFMQLCRGMEAINQQLVHRDIKPENILICNGKLKISDFGLSKIASESTKTMTFKGYGSSRYVAPEAWDNDHATIQMDIYSMGIVFYEIATLEYPYSISPDADLIVCRDAHLYQAPNKAPLNNTDLEAGIVSTIIKMMDKPTQSRYSSWDKITESISAMSTFSLDNGVIKAVEEAISKRNQYDLTRQEAVLAAKREAKRKAENNKLIYTHFEHTILQPIQDFTDQYNSRYQGSAKFYLICPPEASTSKEFNISIKTPSGGKITIETAVIYPEDFVKRVKNVFDEERSVHYTPRCLDKPVLAWSCVSESSSGFGFNLLLLKNETSMYGDWYIMTNQNSGLGNSHRAEPFGFSIKELPREIELINAIHIYKSRVIPFTNDSIYEYLGRYISH